LTRYLLRQWFAVDANSGANDFPMTRETVDFGRAVRRPLFYFLFYRQIAPKLTRRREIPL
jgi:hypothetical protein